MSEFGIKEVLQEIRKFSFGRWAIEKLFDYPLEVPLKWLLMSDSWISLSNSTLVRVTKTDALRYERIYRYPWDGVESPLQYG